MPDLPDGGEWSEWRRLILGDLRRLGDDMRRLDSEVRAIGVSLEVIRMFAGEHDDMDKRLSRLEAQVESITTAGVQKNEDRKWLIGLAVLVVASILFPSLRVVLFGGGG